MEADSLLEQYLERRLAVAHAGRRLGPALESFLSLDARLAGFVSQMKEPILTQIRIAWWRDELNKSADLRPKGDPILDGLSLHWQGEEAALLALVDAWEGLLGEVTTASERAGALVDARSIGFAALAQIGGRADHAIPAQEAGRVWAFADLAAALDGEEKSELLRQREHLAIPNVPKLPHSLRGLSILAKLASKMLASGDEKLITNRSDFLLITRVGIFG